jgi:hypothetical protein
VPVRVSSGETPGLSRFSRGHERLCARLRWRHFDRLSTSPVRSIWMDSVFRQGWAVLFAGGVLLCKTRLRKKNYGSVFDERLLTNR